MQNQPTTGLLFISGAGLGTSLWDDVKNQLPLPSVAVDFTELKKQSSLNDITLQQYVDVALRQARSLPVDKIIIVAHSIGGVIGVEVAKQFHEKATGFVAVSAAIPNPGQSFTSVLPFPQNIITKLILKSAGTKPPESAIKSGLCNDLSHEQANAIVSSFSPESIQLYTQSTTEMPIPSLPSLYILTKQDKEYPEALQRKMATRLKNVHVEEIDSGHLPMIAHPDVIAEKINTFLQGI